MSYVFSGPMTDLLEIRPATAQNLPALLALYEHLTGEPPFGIEKATEVFERFEQYAGSQILIGWLGKEAVASCTLVVIPNLTRAGAPYALIENVVTDVRFRKCGFGRAVLKAAVDQAWQAGCYKTMLLAGLETPSIQRFYEGAGFAQSKTGYQIRRIAARGG